MVVGSCSIRNSWHVTRSLPSHRLTSCAPAVVAILGNAAAAAGEVTGYRIGYVGQGRRSAASASHRSAIPVGGWSAGTALLRLEGI